MFKPGDYIDKRYKVIKELGKGGMGVVLCVEDTRYGKNVALKYCPQNNNKKSWRRFLRETRVMAAIKHPNVMPVLHRNLKYSPPYFTMPLAQQSLSNEIKMGIDKEDALALFKEICLGVQALHNVNATHRDLKLDNVMRMGDGSIVVADMGIAKLNRRETITQNTAFLTQIDGAPKYLIRGGSHEADKKTDILQLGKVLYKLVTSSPQPQTAELPAALSDIIEKATKQRSNQQYQSVGELMEAVESYEV
jgi:serine/threonine-protein kinase